MMSLFLGKRECFAFQSATALAQRVVEALDIIGLATVFADCTMQSRQHDDCIGFPKIGATDSTVAVHCLPSEVAFPYRFLSYPALQDR